MKQSLTLAAILSLALAAKEDMKAAASDAKAGLKEAAQPLADAMGGKEGQEASAAIK